MAVTLLGSTGISSLLSGLGRVAIVNRTAPEDLVTIVALAVVRHQADGSTQQDVAFDMGIEADESVSVEAIPPLAADPDAVEVALRLRIGDDGGMADAYAVAHRPAGESNVQFEFGVKANTEALVDGEDVVPGFAEFAVYGLPAGS